jgi:hypothetical protein
MADNTLSCQRETLHSQQLRSIKKSIDSDHGIYRDIGSLMSVPGTWLPNRDVRIHGEF